MPHVIRIAGLLGASLAIACGARPTAGHEEGGIDTLAWLSGTWQTADQPPSGERWAREGDRLLGTGFAMRPADCAGVDACDDVEEITEQLEIVVREGSLVYVATPIAQERTEFVISEASATHFVAENPSHDFPTRIEYRLHESPRRIEAHVSNAERGFDLVLLAR